MIKLKTLLNEILLKEDFCSDNIGKILFQKFAHFYDKNKDETDTEYEKRVYTKLKDFIRGDFNNNKKDNELVKIITSLMKCKDKVPTALTPPNKKLYRGSYATSEMFWGYFSENVDIFNLDGTNKRLHKEVSKPYLYKPKSVLQSWTTEISVAEAFVVKQRNSKGFEYGFPIIYKMRRPNKDFIFNDDFLNLFHFDENEVIRMGGNLRVDSIIYYPSDILEFMKKNNIKK